MDQGELYRRIRANEEYRRLSSDPEFDVILDVGGRFFRAMIGDREGGFRAWRRVRTLEAAIEWLQSKVLELYPYSSYGKHLGAEMWRTAERGRTGTSGADDQALAIAGAINRRWTVERPDQNVILNPPFVTTFVPAAPVPGVGTAVNENVPATAVVVKPVSVSVPLLPGVPELAVHDAALVGTRLTSPLASMSCFGGFVGSSGVIV
jgi:hypothetical protein